MFVKVTFLSARAIFNPNVKRDDKIKGDWIYTHPDEYVPRYQQMHTIITNNDIGNPFGTAHTLIHLSQVSNMLHVMLGERPVSAFHTPRDKDGAPLRKRIERIDEIVRNGWFKVDTPYVILCEDGKGNTYTHILYEYMTGTRGWHSNIKNEIITWNRVRMLCSREKGEYDRFMDIINRYAPSGDATMDYDSWTEMVANLTPTQIDELQRIHGLKKKWFNGALLRGGRVNCYGAVSNGTIQMNTICIDGSFIFNVTEDEYKRLVCGSQCATFLDGGLAELSKWDNASYGVERIDIDTIEDSGYAPIPN